ncbi:hypothetical protein AB0K52_00340 [Glycomyces sp. NPDC049804]|uniref:hypothetical protein n=1 Tax=Glycomyces sp. NPDC049804 TaxID=3154363 RepID=UPI003447ACB4
MADPGRRPSPEEGRSDIRLAWISLAAVPVAYAAAAVLGSLILEAQGYEIGSDRAAPVGASLIAGIPATLVLLAPCVGAIWFGSRARRRGRPSGKAAVIAGYATLAFLILTNILGFFIGR